MTRDSDTKSFVLRVDAATMEALEEWAADEFRSINGQLQWIVADALRRSGRTPLRRVLPFLKAAGLGVSWLCCRPVGEPPAGRKKTSEGSSRLAAPLVFRDGCG